MFQVTTMYFVVEPSLKWVETKGMSVNAVDATPYRIMSSGKRLIPT